MWSKSRRSRRRMVRAPGSRCGAFDMDSLQPATTSLRSPALMACAASMTALSAEPHTLLTVNDGTVSGMPAPRAAARAGFWPRPACRTLPRMTSSTSPGWMRARRSASLTATAPSSVAFRLDRAPWNLPMGVRQPATRTAVSTGALDGPAGKKPVGRCGRDHRGLQGDPGVFPGIPAIHVREAAGVLWVGVGVVRVVAQRLLAAVGVSVPVAVVVAHVAAGVAVLVALLGVGLLDAVVRHVGDVVAVEVALAAAGRRRAQVAAVGDAVAVGVGAVVGAGAGVGVVADAVAVRVGMLGRGVWGGGRVGGGVGAGAVAVRVDLLGGVVGERVAVVADAVAVRVRPLRGVVGE